MEQNSVAQTSSLRKSSKSKAKTLKRVHFSAEDGEELQQQALPRKKVKNSQSEAKESAIARLGQDSQNQNRKRWVDKAAKKGKFNDNEINILKNAICKYVKENNLGQHGLEELILAKRDTKFHGAWSKIGEALPQRSVQSLHNYCKRHFNPMNYKGQWTPEQEQRLLQAVDYHGRKWVDLQKDFGRTATNLRDKYRELGEKNAAQRDKNIWTFAEGVTLLRRIQKCVDVRFFKIKKLKEDLSQNEELYQNILSRSERQKNRFAGPSEGLMRLMSYIDYEVARNIAFEELNWSNIAQHIKTKSVDDCRNMWRYHMLPCMYENNCPFEAKDDEILVKAIMQQEADSEDELEFNIGNGKSVAENSHRWKILKKQVGYRRKIGLSEALKCLSNHYQIKEKEREIEHIFSDESPETSSKKLKAQEQSDALLKLYQRDYE